MEEYKKQGSISQCFKYFVKSLFLLILNTSLVFFSSENLNANEDDDFILRFKPSTEYTEDILEEFLFLIDSLDHSYKDIKHMKNIEQFMGKKVFSYQSIMSNFIKEAWILSEKKGLKLAVRLELFGLYLGQKSYQKEGLTRSMMQEFFIRHYLDIMLEMLGKYIDEHDFSSKAFGTDIPFSSVFVGKNCLFDSAKDLRLMAKKILNGKFWFLDIPVEFFSNEYFDKIKGSNQDDLFQEELLSSILRWTIEYNDRYPPDEDDFTQKSKKVGITKNRVIGVKALFRDYNDFLDRFYKYSKKQGESINYGKKPTDKITEDFIRRWSDLFLKIRNKSIDQDTKIKFLDSCLEWMSLFNRNHLGQLQFINSTDLTSRSFGIYLSAVVGPSRLFYSMYTLQKELIEQAKKKGLFFIVRENLPIEVPGSYKDYILSTTLDWIKKHKRLPGASEFKMDTFSDNVGISYSNFLRAFGFKGYEAILNKVYEYALGVGVEDEYLDLFSDRMKSYSKISQSKDKYEEFKRRWKDVFERVKKKERSDEVKELVFEAILEWIEKFNQNKFLRSVEIEPKTFGIDCLHIVGEDGLFYSMFELQTRLIEYCKKVGKRFIVREGLPMRINPKVSKEEYILDLCYNWIKDKNFLLLPSVSDFGLDRFSGKVGFNYKAIQGVFETLGYHNLIYRVYLYAKNKGASQKELDIFKTSINEDYIGNNSREKRGKKNKTLRVFDKKDIQDFQTRWKNSIDLILDKNQDKELKKIHFMNLILDWIENFNNGEFISSNQLSTQEIGINIRDVIGECRVFYSIYTFQQELISYSKSISKTFKVREDVGLKVDTKDLIIYILDKIYDWIKINGKMVEIDDFSLDTFYSRVGILWSSVCRVLGSRNFDKIMTLLYEYVLVRKNDSRVLGILKNSGFPKIIDESSSAKKFLKLYSKLVGEEISGALDNQEVSRCIQIMSE